MDSNLQTSFIPKKTLVPAQNSKPVRPTNFLSVISTVIFVTAIALCGAVFAYKIYMNRSLDSLKAELKTEIKKFDNERIDELIRLDNRIQSSQTLLNKHLSVSSFFNFLSSVTLTNIRFNSFGYRVDPNGKTEVVLGGEAKSFSDVSYQQSRLSEEDSTKVISDPVFSNLNLGEDGTILFMLTAKVNDDALLYGKLVAPAESPASGPAASTTPAAQ